MIILITCGQETGDRQIYRIVYISFIIYCFNRISLDEQYFLYVEYSKVSIGVISKRFKSHFKNLRIFRKRK